MEGENTEKSSSSSMDDRVTRKRWILPYMEIGEKSPPGGEDKNKEGGEESEKRKDHHVCFARC